MTNVIRSILFCAVLVAISGCKTNIPARIEVRDVASGHLYTTYEPWAKKESGMGYQFTDIETGKKVTLTNYELRTLEAKKSVDNNGPEATAYEEAMTRAGMK